MNGKIYVAGIGPGCEADVTPAVAQALRESDVIVGYKYYFRFVEQYLSQETECVSQPRSGMCRYRHET